MRQLRPAAEVPPDHLRDVRDRLVVDRRGPAVLRASGPRTRSSPAHSTTGSAGPALWAIGLVTALLTAFYMTRQVILTFYGDSERWRDSDDHALVGAGAGRRCGGGSRRRIRMTTTHHDDHGHHLSPDHTPHESPWTMTVPLVVLADLLDDRRWLLNLPFSRLAPLPRALARADHRRASTSCRRHRSLWTLAIIATSSRRGRHRRGATGSTRPDGSTRRGSRSRCWPMRGTSTRRTPRSPADRVRRRSRAWPTSTSGSSTARSTASAGGAKRIGDGLRPIQSGLVRTYALGIAVGAVLLLAFVVTRMSI